MAGVWAATVTVWMLLDRWFTGRIRRLESVEVDENTPAFARGPGRQGGIKQRPFLEWLAAWLGREVLALPIWTWAVLLGATVNWRGKQFLVRMDMSVVEVGGSQSLASAPSAEDSRPNSRNKDRVD
jgi:ceramide glucosyltransferase